MALDSAVSAVAATGDDDPDPDPAASSSGSSAPSARRAGARPTHGLVRWGASRWSWYDDTAAARARGAARQIGPAHPGRGPVGSSSI